VKPFIHAIAARLLAALLATVSFQYNRVRAPVSQHFVFCQQKQSDSFLFLQNRGEGQAVAVNESNFARTNRARIADCA
jgi:hypothetical protein